MADSTRLERAMAIYVATVQNGAPPDATIAAHPELADLLNALFASTEQSTGDAPSGRQFGDYTIERELGRGGMGVVYAARQRSLQRMVALKVLAPEVASNATQIARLRREALTLARLDHPHVVKVFDVGETDGNHWLAMELIDGESFDQLLTRLREGGGHRGDSLRVAVNAIAEVADALEHVHQAGVLHRDVKPSNILLRRDQHALLSDFGLARDDSTPTVTRAGSITGTPHYMSPEHLLGAAALLPASDVFSLGAALYEALTLHKPFDGASTDVVLSKILSYDPPDPRRLNRALPADLAAIALKAIEKDPLQRYATARELHADLRAFLELRSVTARPPSTWQRLRRYARREPLRAALATLLVLAVGLGGLLLLQLPAVRRAELAQREEAYEEAIARGDLARQARDRSVADQAFAEAQALFPDRREPLLWRLLTVMETGTAGEALNQLEDQVGADSGDEGLERLRCVLWRQTGSTKEAEQLEQRLGAPTTPTGMTFTAASLLLRGGPGDFVRAGQLMSMAVRMTKQPRLFLYACWAGIAPAEQQQECASAILSHWPNSGIALQQAALCLRDLEPDRAYQLQLRAIAGHDDLGSHPRYFLAKFALRAGRKAEAVEAAKASLTEDVLADTYRANLIETILHDQDPAAGEAELLAWLAREPDNAEALQLRMRRLTRAEEFAAARGDAERALRAKPGDIEIEAMLGRLQWRTGDVALAEATLRRVLAVAPDHTDAHKSLVACLSGQGKSADVFAELRRRIANVPNDNDAPLKLANGLQRTGGPDELREALDVIADLDYRLQGKDAKVLELRATIHGALGEAAAAETCRKRIK